MAAGSGKGKSRQINYATEKADAIQEAIYDELVDENIIEKLEECPPFEFDKIKEDLSYSEEKMIKLWERAGFESIFLIGGDRMKAAHVDLVRAGGNGIFYCHEFGKKVDEMGKGSPNEARNFLLSLTDFCIDGLKYSDPELNAPSVKGNHSRLLAGCTLQTVTDIVKKGMSNFIVKFKLS